MHDSASRPRDGYLSNWIRDRRARTAVLASVAVHVLVIYGVSQVRWSPSHVRLPPEPRRIIWIEERSIFAPERAPAEDSPARQEEFFEAAAGDDEPIVEQPAAGQENEQLPPAREDDDVGDVADREEDAEHQADDVLAAADWLGARRRALEAVREEQARERSYRSFTVPEGYDPDDRRETRRPRSMFDSPSVGRAGLTFPSPAGEQGWWITDECYQVLGTTNLFVLPAAQWLYASPMTHCVRTTARSDLFEHLKGEREVVNRVLASGEAGAR